MTKLLRTHRARMSKYVDKFAKICLAFQIGLMVLLGLFLGVANNTTKGDNSGIELIPNWWARFGEKY
jgi:hypothetical protein